MRVYSRPAPPRLGPGKAESPGALRRGSRTVSRGVHGVGDWHLFPVGGLEIANVFEYLSATRTTYIHGHPTQSIFGLRSSCDRAEFMLALVMTLAPVSIVAGTFSPFEAASAVLTAS